MTTPGAEDDVVERLRAGDCSYGCSDADREEAIALITRLREELKEAKELLVAQRNDMPSEEMAKHLVDWLEACPGVYIDDDLRESARHNIGETIKDARADIRSKTIEECAEVADRWSFGPYRALAAMNAADEIAKAIRAIDGGGKP